MDILEFLERMESRTRQGICEACGDDTEIVKFTVGTLSFEVCGTCAAKLYGEMNEIVGIALFLRPAMTEDA